MPAGEVARETGAYLKRFGFTAEKGQAVPLKDLGERLD